MSRLTNKHFSINPPRSIKKCRQDFYVAVEDKLRRLEDLEDEIGCSLEVLFKALTDGVYANIPDITNGIEFFKELRLGRIIGGQWRLIVLREGKWNNFPLYLGCFGKTWALTKEELEKSEREI